MSIAYVIHSDADLDFVENMLLPCLPSNGFDRWLSSTFVKARHDLTLDLAMQACDVILAVISPAAARSNNVRAEIEDGRNHPIPMIAVQAEALTRASRNQFPDEVWLLPLVDLRKPALQVRQELAALLPLPQRNNKELAYVAQLIDWNEEIFSEALRNVLSLHDYNQAATLVTHLWTCASQDLQDCQNVQDYLDNPEKSRESCEADR